MADVELAPRAPEAPAEALNTGPTDVAVVVTDSAPAPAPAPEASPAAPAAPEASAAAEAAPAAEAAAPAASEAGAVVEWGKGERRPSAARAAFATKDAEVSKAIHSAAAILSAEEQHGGAGR